MTFVVPKPAWKGGFFLSCLAATGFLGASIWLIFQPALPGIVHFDDVGNLSKLSSISNLDSAWRWIQEGQAGPFGRPLALLTFALQYYQWPHPEAFLQWNITFHIINALLIFWLGVLVARRLGESAERQLAIGFCVAFAWGALPLLNSSVMFIVQRMTLLCSTFTLAGLIGYVKLRGPVRASALKQAGALVVLGGFGTLALLSKENGALIVIYALILELAFLIRAHERRPTLTSVLLLLACALLLAGLTPHAIWSACAELTRGFDLMQRLGSQGVLLPVYLKGLFFPRAAELNPFRFEFLLRDMPNLQWGIAIWVMLMAAPVVVWWRGWKMLALAMTWFLYGHIMESGWVNLEPYFAHRNYLPAVGLVFALVYGVFAIHQGAKFWRGVLGIYMVILAGLTWMNASLWGNRLLAAEIWALEQPRSVRAALNLAYGLERTEGLGAAHRHLDRFVIEGRDSVGLRLQSLVSACVLAPDVDQSSRLLAVHEAIAKLPYEAWATDMVDKLMETVRRQGCQGVTIDQVGQLAAAFLSQPLAYQCSRPTIHNMLMIIGLVAMEHGDTQQAMDFYLQGLRASVSYSMAAFYFDLASEQGDRTAIENLQSMLQSAPLPRSTTQAEWQQLLDRIDARSRELSAAEKMSLLESKESKVPD